MSSTRSRFRPAPATKPAPWRERALLLVAHGVRGGGANDALDRHVAALGERRLFAEVAGATLAGGQDPADALAGLGAAEAYIVPFFMTDGLAVRDLLPRRLGLAGPVTERDGRRYLLCPPVGLNGRLARVIADRAEQLARRHGLAARDTTLLLVAHGTTRNPASERATEDQAARTRKGGTFAAVATAFLDQPPTLPEVLAGLDGPAVAVGLFAEDGRHAGQDIPRILAGRKPPVPYLGAIGPDSEIAELIIEQVTAFDAGQGG